jgi:hypothetical protein
MAITTASAPTVSARRGRSRVLPDQLSALQPDSQQTSLASEVELCRIAAEYIQLCDVVAAQLDLLADTVLPSLPL